MPNVEVEIPRGPRVGREGHERLDVADAGVRQAVGQQQAAAERLRVAARRDLGAAALPAAAQVRRVAGADLPDRALRLGARLRRRECRGNDRLDRVVVGDDREAIVGAQRVDAGDHRLPGVNDLLPVHRTGTVHHEREVHRHALVARGRLGRLDVDADEPAAFRFGADQRTIGTDVQHQCPSWLAVAPAASDGGVVALNRAAVTVARATAVRGPLLLRAANAAQDARVGSLSTGDEHSRERLTDSVSVRRRGDAGLHALETIEPSRVCSWQQAEVACGRERLQPLRTIRS